MVIDTGGQHVRQLVADLGIRLIVIGIGNFDITTIECLADDQDVFQVDGFSDHDFNILVQGVKPILCGETLSPTTPRPTPQPVTTGEPTQSPIPKCSLGTNYNFEGQSCTLSGDPHTTMFNGNKHDFQGTPTVGIPGATNDEKRNQFYYIHPCAGESMDDMPLRVAATHYHWGTRSVSGTVSCIQSAPACTSTVSLSVITYIYLTSVMHAFICLYVFTCTHFSLVYIYLLTMFLFLCVNIYILHVNV